MSALVVLLCFLASCMQAPDELRSQRSTTGPATAPANAYRIVFIGNSITRHGVNADTIARLKWDHVAGMAATSQDKDFAHLLTAMIQQSMPDRKVVPEFSAPPPDGKPPEERAAFVAERLKGAHPDLIVFQHGEHEQKDLGVEPMEQTYRQVLEVLKKVEPRPLIICVGVWGVEDGPAYTLWNKTLNETMAKACSEEKIPYVSVEKIGCDPACSGWGEHPGVKWHPNDEGHKRYADAIFSMWQRQQPQRRSRASLAAAW